MKTTIIIITVAILIGAGILFVADPTSVVNTKQEDVQNVSIVDGKQIITIRAKGGYTPRVSTAQAGIPTVVRFDTKGTFDCSASVRIPSADVSELLPNSGTKDIDLGIQKVGTLQGSCGMGMYPFEIHFLENQNEKCNHLYLQNDLM